MNTSGSASVDYRQPDSAPLNKAMRIFARRWELALAGLTLAAGLAIAFSTLSRGVWLDEFFTYHITAYGVTSGQFLAAMAREPAPLLHNGLVFLAQAGGLTTFVGLRALNILGVALVFVALWFAVRREAINLSSACIVVRSVLFSLFRLFRGTPPYCLLYLASMQSRWPGLFSSDPWPFGGEAVRFIRHGGCLAVL